MFLTESQIFNRVRSGDTLRVEIVDDTPGGDSGAFLAPSQILNQVFNDANDSLRISTGAESFILANDGRRLLTNGGAFIRGDNR